MKLTWLTDKVANSNGTYSNNTPIKLLIKVKLTQIIDKVTNSNENNMND